MLFLLHTYRFSFLNPHHPEARMGRPDISLHVADILLLGPGHPGVAVWDGDFILQPRFVHFFDLFFLSHATTPTRTEGT